MDKYFNVNGEGRSIRCKLYAEGKAPERVVLCGHGFGGHKDGRALERFARRVLEKNKGAAVLCFDWPAHGEDARKTLRLEDCSLYLRLILAYLRESFAGPEVFGYAVSFGGYLFLKYLSEAGNPFVKLALRCPAVDIFEGLNRNILTEEDRRRLERGKPVQAGFDRKVEIDRAFMESLREADLTKRDFLPWADDMLILQGTKDEIVSFEAVKAFAEENVIEFEAVEGADHRFQDPKKADLATARILAFFGMR